MENKIIYLHSVEDLPTTTNILNKLWILEVRTNTYGYEDYTESHITIEDPEFFTKLELGIKGSRYSYRFRKAEENKLCPYCGAIPQEGSNNLVSCMNATCRLYAVHFDKKEWNTRVNTLRSTMKTIRQLANADRPFNDPSVKVLKETLQEIAKIAGENE